MDDDSDIYNELSDEDLLDIVKDTLGEGFDQEDTIEEEIRPEEITKSDELEEDEIFDFFDKDIDILNEGITTGLDISSDGESNSLENEGVAKESKSSKIPILISISNLLKEKLKTKPKINLSYTKTTAIILGSLIAFVFIGGILIVMIIRSSQVLDLEEFNHADTIIIENFTSGPNNSNFIFISETRLVGDNAITLTRMLIDQTATIFYFNQDLNWENYSLSLTDNNGKSYLVQNSFFDDDKAGDIVSFEPLDTGIRGIILTVTNIQTGEEAQFAIRFESNITIMPALYIDSRFSILDEENINITVQGGTFSSAGSSILYTLNSSQNEIISFGNVSLMQGSQINPNTNHLKYNIEGENSYIGRIDFAPVKNMSNNISLRFEDVFTVHRLDMEVPLQGLFRNTVADQIEIPIGANTVVLERIGRRGDNYILVLYGTNEYGDRIETRLNATLRFENDLGEEVILEANTRSGDRGTDMLFNINQLSESGVTGQLSTFVLNIEDVLFIQDDFIVTIPLDDLQHYIRPSTENVINQGKDLLLEQGYINVELITYMIDSHEFTGVYSVRRNNVTTEYLVTGSRESSTWNLTHSLIQ